MEENKFDKENISTLSSCDVPGSLMVWDNQTVYDIGEKRGVWWQCPKCGADIIFDSMDEGFDEELGENQFFTIYSWNCEECGAEGNVHAVVNPLCISVD